MRRLRSLTVLAMAVALTAAACDWPMPGHGPARTGSSPDQSISRQALTTDSLELSWTASLQEGVWDATPVVADGTVAELLAAPSEFVAAMLRGER